MSTLWVVSYDVADDDRRRAVAETLENHGLRVQYSVFECRLGVTDLQALREKLKQLIDPAEDSIRWYHLCAWCEERDQDYKNSGERDHRSTLECDGSRHHDWSTCSAPSA